MAKNSETNTQSQNHESFSKALESISKDVKTWPKWKQNALCTVKTHHNESQSSTKKQGKKK